MSVAAADHQRRGFTIVELMVSMAILIVLMLMLVSVTDSTRRTWMYTTAGIQQFRDAREAFESVTRRLSQATLNTYWDYNNDSAPTSYLRQSDLRFLCVSATAITTETNAVTHAVFFQAPLGYVSTTNYPSLPGANLTRLLNTWGFFIEFADDSQLRPPFLTSKLVPYRSRFRLMELMEPSDSLTIYQYTSGLNTSTTPPTPNNLNYTGHDWFINPLKLSPRPARVLAENIVALVLLPKLSPADETAGNYNDSSLAPNYSYDSTNTTVSDPNLGPRNQLPPEVQVTMVAVDETSYNRLQGISTSPPRDINNALTTGAGGGPLFTTVASGTNAIGGYQQDLQTLQTALQTDHLSYRVFTSDVSIEAAKWSREQKN